MLVSLFLVTFPNKLLYFVCIRYLVVLQWLRPWSTLLLNLIVLNLIVLVYCYKLLSVKLGIKTVKISGFAVFSISKPDKLKNDTYFVIWTPKIPKKSIV